VSNIWDKTIDVKEALVSELISSQFELKASVIKSLGEGYDNSAFLVNDKYVFRFPHREQLSPTCMANEITLLPYLLERLSFPLPNLTMIGQPTAIYPFQFAGYEILAGELLTEHQAPLVEDPESATILGAWLKELHALPILNTHKKLIQGEHDWRLDVVYRTQCVIESITQYEQYFIDAGFEPAMLIKTIDFFQDLKIDKSKEGYVHGDLYAKHILVKENGLPAGLIDWGDVHIGHPATDLSIGMMIFNENSLECFFNAYTNYNKDMLDIALFRAFFHPILSLPYFAQIGEITTSNWIKAALDNAIRLIDQKESRK
jgi:aminoglycoside phosphotransferase (APT) family kinase protein